MKLVAGRLTVVLVLSAGMPAHADTLYLDEAAFLAAAGPVTMESFEALGVSSSDVFSVDAGPFTIITPTAASLRVRNTAVFGTHATDGIQFVQFDGLSDFSDPLGRGINLSRSALFTFDLAINRFGVTLTDFRGQVGLVTNAGASFPSALSGVPPEGSENFVGLIADNSFTQLGLIWSLGPNVGMDEVLYANDAPTAVPEPSSLLLFGSGVLTVAAKARGRRRLRPPVTAHPEGES